MAQIVDAFSGIEIMSKNDNRWTEDHVRCLDCFSFYSSSVANDTEDIDMLCRNGYCSDFYAISNNRLKR